MGVGLGLLSLAASATTIDNGAAFEYVTGGIRITDGPGTGTFIGRNFEPVNTTARTIGLNDTLQLPHVSREIGKPVTAVVARTLTMGALASAAANVGGAAMVGYEIGSGIAKLLGLGDPSNGTRIVPTADGYKFDPGEAPTTSQVVCQRGYSHATSPYPSQAPACIRSAAQAVAEDGASWVQRQAAAAAQQTPTNSPIYAYVGLNGSCADVAASVTRSCSFFYTIRNWGPYSGPNNTPGYGPPGQQTQQISILGVASSQTGCPGFTDPFDLRLSRPAGDAPGPDGKCATGRYQAATPTQVTQQITQYGKPEGMKEVAERILSQGKSIPDAGPREVVEVNPPAEIGQPQTTTTTNPDGSTTTTTKTPTTTYVKTGDSITYNQTFNTVTQTCTGSGNCTTSTTTTTTPSTTKTTDDKDHCTINPDSVGCAKLGDAGAAKPESKTSPFSITAVEFGGSGSCPAPVPLSVFGQSLQLSFAPMCDTITTWVRPLVLVAAFALAAFIFVGGLKS